MTFLRSRLLFLPFLLAACAGPTGDVTVLLQPEDTILNGLDSGSSLDTIVDGWSVRYTKYVVAIGDVKMRDSATGLTEEDPTYHVVNLRDLPQTGVTFSTFSAVEAVRFDQFGYDVHFGQGATRDATTSQDDFDRMMANGWTFLIEGTLTNDAGETVTFHVPTKLDVTFSNCETQDGLPGVTVTPTGATVAITLHGDHLFFNGFPSGAELIERRAQWLVDCDVDGNGDVTPEEMMSTDAASVFPPEHYMLAGAPLSIMTAWDFARAQLSTTGHFQGEGGCPWTIDR